MTDPIPREELLRYFQPGERLTVREVWERQRETAGRSLLAVKQGLLTLRRRGALAVAGVQAIPGTGQQSTLYVLTGQSGALPGRFETSRLADVLRAVLPGEWVTVAQMRERLPGIKPSFLGHAMFDLAKRGNLIKQGRKGEIVRYALPDGAPSAATAQPVPPSEHLPFLALFTPPLPAFRIKSTRRVLNLIGRDEDDEREAA